MKRARLYLRAEGLFLFLLTVVLFAHNHFNFVWYLVFLLAPDISMLGYLINNKWGALFYNLGHTLIMPVSLFIITTLTGSRILLAITIVWLAHIGMDRFLGFGLKLESGFKNTTLGKIS